MYWKEVPLQVQAEDDSGQVSKPLDDRFQQGADAISMFDGSSGGDEYLDGFQWGDYLEAQGTAEDAASSAAHRFNTGFPENFVARVRELDRDGKRDPRPGAADGWIEG
jgi:hypothetical protein